MRVLWGLVALGLSGCIVVPVELVVPEAEGGGVIDASDDDLVETLPEDETGVFSDPISTTDDDQFEDPNPNLFEEDLFLVLLNDERGNVSAQPVVYNALLTEAAQAYAEDLVANNRFDHIGLDGSTPGDRVSATGYQWAWVAENLFRGSTKEEAAIQTWMDSTAGHREAMLEERAEEIGVGLEDTTYVLILADPL